MCTSTWKGLKNCTCQNSLFYTMVKGKGARYHCIRTPSWIWDRSKKASQASQGFSVHHIALKTSIPVLMKNQKLHFSLDVYFVSIVGKMVDQFFSLDSEPGSGHRQMREDSAGLRKPSTGEGIETKLPSPPEGMRGGTHGLEP